MAVVKVDAGGESIKGVDDGECVRGERKVCGGHEEELDGDDALMVYVGYLV
jgi:hypothetical protein